MHDKRRDEADGTKIGKRQLSPSVVSILSAVGKDGNENTSSSNEVPSSFLEIRKSEGGKERGDRDQSR